MSIMSNNGTIGVPRTNKSQAKGTDGNERVKQNAEQTLKFFEEHQRVWDQTINLSSSMRVKVNRKGEL